MHYDTQQSHAQQEQKSRVAISPARALNAFTKEGQKRNQPVDAPSQSVLLSTQAQLERLKDEVSHLDELVNRLKAQHISTFDQEGVSQTAHYHDEQGHEGHGHNDNNHDEEYATDSRDRKAENMYKQEQAEYDRKRKEILEFESSIASQNDILRLIRHVDSLVWMRNTLSSSSSSPYIPLHSSQSRTQSQLNQTEDEKRKYVGSNNGKGPRNDNIIFTRGNLHHLAKRITAWENIVRRKEEEGRYDYIT